MNAALSPTRNDLPDATRLEMTRRLDEVLAGVTQLGLHARMAHWNVRGPHFQQLHELFDQVYQQAGEWADLLAERAVQLGGTADVRLETLAARGDLPAWRIDHRDGAASVEQLAAALAAVAARVRAAIAAAEQAGDAGTADLFTEISRAADKLLWFVEAHAHDGR
ncbi:MAG: DNA starvation/stationary phase protection protein Dps [Acidobacteria bacterium]|nr:MAG: DNA starvation/stationary phase protection protein Dps [Acidobacteriota bacterium]